MVHTLFNTPRSRIERRSTHPSPNVAIYISCQYGLKAGRTAIRDEMTFPAIMLFNEQIAD